MRALTLMELMIAVMIMSILSVVALVLFQGQSERARVAAARFEIRTIETAISQYETDVGSFPPSSSGTNRAPAQLLPIRPFLGNSFLFVALMQSLNGNPTNPLDPAWNGPYLSIGDRKVGPGDINGSLLFDPAMFLDPWGNPYHYVRAGDEVNAQGLPVEYIEFGATEIPNLNPINEQVFFNLKTFQLISFGPNGESLEHPRVGLEEDDITNFDHLRFTRRD